MSNLQKYIEDKLQEIKERSRTYGCWEELLGQRRAYEDVLEQLKQDE